MRLPFAARCEQLWRKDPLYDLLLVSDYNMAPARRGLGSAIFLHVAKPDFQPTEGCVALRPQDLRRLLPRLGPRVTLVLGPVSPRPLRRLVGVRGHQLLSPKMAVPIRTSVAPSWIAVR